MRNSQYSIRISSHQITVQCNIETLEEFNKNALKIFKKCSSSQSPLRKEALII